MKALRPFLTRPPAGVMAIVGAALLAIGLAPLPIGRTFTLKSLNQQISERTGLTAVADKADVRLSFLPFPKARILNLRITDPHGAPLARIGVLDAYLRPLDLIGGRLRFTGYAVSEAIIDAGEPAARAAWRTAGRKLIEATLQPSAPSPAELSVERSAVATGSQPLTDVTATISWGGAGSALSAWARGRWKGEETEIRLSDFQPDTFFASQGKGPVRFAVRSPFASIDYAGDIEGPEAPRGEGLLKLSVSSADRLGRWLGFSAPLSGVIDRYSFEGRGPVSTRGFSSAAATVTTGASQLEGTLALRVDDGRPQISGTLATQDVDFDAIGSSLDSVRDTAGAWSQDGFDPSPLKRTDVDLRLSASRVRLLGARLGEAAISIMLKSGRLEFVLGRAQAYQGALRGRASLQALDGERVEARLQANFEDMDIGATLQDVAGRRLASGRAQGQLQLESTGRSATEIAKLLSGKINAQLKDGDLAGFNLVDAMRRPDRLSAELVSAQAGRTTFQSLDVSATLAQGVADTQDATLTASGGVAAVASGQASVRDQTITLNGVARAPSIPGDGLRFTLSGPWRQPSLQWQYSSVFKRS
ncbi:AsmA family protein [Terrarubrum flagellatum]|uniref:AsmA family protein n=1 Tax=Terrirubrum flagellatum TaxID=2895980 RepID=UPI0031456C4B